MIAGIMIQEQALCKNEGFSFNEDTQWKMESYEKNNMPAGIHNAGRSNLV